MYKHMTLLKIRFGKHNDNAIIDEALWLLIKKMREEKQKTGDKSKGFRLELSEFETETESNIHHITLSWTPEKKEEMANG